jgi:hypothetical protein
MHNVLWIKTQVAVTLSLSFLLLLASSYILMLGPRSFLWLLLNLS